MLNESHPLTNLIYTIVSIYILWKHAPMLNRLHRIAIMRAAQEVVWLNGGPRPTLRIVPYSAQVSTMMFSFAAAVQIIVYGAMVLLNVNGMDPWLQMLVNIRNGCFMGGSLASLKHKTWVYRDNAEEDRGKPPTIVGKVDGGGGMPVPQYPPDSGRQPDGTRWHRQVLRFNRSNKVMKTIVACMALSLVAVLGQEACSGTAQPKASANAQVAVNARATLDSIEALHSSACTWVVQQHAAGKIDEGKYAELSGVCDAVADAENLANAQLAVYLNTGTLDAQRALNDAVAAAMAEWMRLDAAKKEVH